jgi:hypothetical protein
LNEPQRRVLKTDNYTIEFENRWWCDNALLKFKGNEDRFETGAKKKLELRTYFEAFFLKLKAFRAWTAYFLVSFSPQAGLEGEMSRDQQYIDYNSQLASDRDAASMTGR